MESNKILQIVQYMCKYCTFQIATFLTKHAKDVNLALFSFKLHLNCEFSQA